MPLEIGAPKSEEVEGQLARMLASKRFRNAGSQSEFLALVVRRALAGKKTPGHIIAKKLFPNKVSAAPNGKLQIIGNDVRVTANNLRRTLGRYQADEGREDPVVICLPQPAKDRTLKLAEGEAYTPQFAYSEVHPAVREIKLGRHFLHRGHLQDDEMALLHFGNALTICPHHLEAAIGVVESRCALLEWGQNMDEETRNTVGRNATRVLDEECESGSTYWRLYAAAGNAYFHSSRDDRIELAAQFFVRSMSLDRLSTESYIPFLDFLMLTGHNNEALTLTKRYLDANDDDIRAYTTHIKALAKCGQFGEAEATLNRALIIDRSDAFVQYFGAQLRIWQGRYQEALPHIEFMKMLTDIRSFGLLTKPLAEHLGTSPKAGRVKAKNTRRSSKHIPAPADKSKSVPALSAMRIRKRNKKN